MLNLSLNELKQIAKSRDIKGYNSMSEYRLLISLIESKSVKESEKNFDDVRIEKIKKDFNVLRDFHFYEIKNQKKSYTKNKRD